MSSIQELIFLGAIILVLSATGLMPIITNGLRALRGEAIDEPPSRSGGDLDMCYRLLGLSPSAKWEEIERAYKRKAKIHHPDLGGDEDMMRALNEAYNRIKRSRKG